MRRDRNPSVGTTVTGGVVSLRVNARFDSMQRAGDELDRTVRACHDALGDLIYGRDDQTLQGWLVERLRTSTPPETVATAESCTGGLLAKMITDIPGSSAVYRQGWVTYSNESKTELLGVPAGLIERFGAVSEAVVKVMANSARARARSDYALAVSGVAGPDGGTPEKPVGTVCIALADTRDVATRTFNFPGDREMIRDRSVKMALTMLRYQLLGRKMPF